MHNIGDMSLNYVSSVQSDFNDGIFQRVYLYETSSLMVLCLSKPNQLSLKRASKQQQWETSRTFDLRSNVFDFLVHSSLQYVLALTQDGRVNLFR